MDRVLEKKRRLSPRVLLIGLGALAILLATWFAIKGVSGDRLRVEAKRLTIATVESGPFQEFIPITGTVEPLRSVVLDAGSGGRVEALFLEGGERVEAGTPILRLSNDAVELNYMNLETNLLEQADQLRNTKITLENSRLLLRDQLLQLEQQIGDLGQQYRRSESLFRDSVISEQEFFTLKNNYEYAQKRRNLLLQRIEQDSILSRQQLGQVNKSLGLVSRNLDVIQRNLDRLTLRAPVSGLLSSISIDVGEHAVAGQNLGQIDVLDGYKVRARIDEHYITRLARGQLGRFSFDGKKHRLVVAKVYPEVENGTFAIDMEFADPAPEGIKRGQSLQIRLALSEETEALLLPRGGFYQHTGGKWVYVVEADGKEAYPRSIRLGRKSDRYYEVREGLEPGERVITSSYAPFNEAEVLVLEP